jgi:hypothetical protein
MNIDTRNIQAMFPLWTVKNIRISESKNAHITVDPKAPYTISSSKTITSLSVDVDSHGKPSPGWLDRYIFKIDSPNAYAIETATYEFPNTLIEFLTRNQKKIDAYHKEHWNSIVRQQFDELFSGRYEEQDG